jgi:hypothetical protein
VIVHGSTEESDIIVVLSLSLPLSAFSQSVNSFHSKLVIVAMWIHNASNRLLRLITNRDVAAQLRGQTERIKREQKMECDS